jgi:hypothetical protein
MRYLRYAAVGFLVVVLGCLFYFVFSYDPPLFSVPAESVESVPTPTSGFGGGHALPGSGFGGSRGGGVGPD